MSKTGAARIHVAGADGFAEEAALVGELGGTPPDLGWQGAAVAVSGDTALVGAPGPLEAQGTAFVFTRTGTLWQQETELVPSEDETGNNFAASVALSGDLAAIGAWYADAFTGKVYVFSRVDGVWSPGQVVVPDLHPYGIGFGVSVALSGDRLVVGAHYSDAPTVDSGAAYVFRRNRLGEWEQDAILTAEQDAQTEELFGASVAIDQTTVLVGAPSGRKAEGLTTGLAYVFARDEDGSWVRQQRFVPSRDVAIQNLGGSVAISGDLLAIGAKGTTVPVDVPVAGAVHLSTRKGGVWSPLQEIAAPSEATGDGFGQSVALDGRTLLVGAPRVDSDPDDQAGKVYAFELQLDHGEPCTSGSQCASSFCVEAVCCNDPCVAPGMACSSAKKGGGQDGECALIGGAGSNGGGGDGGDGAGSDGGGNGGDGASSAGEMRSYYSCNFSQGTGLPGSPISGVVGALLFAGWMWRRRASGQSVVS